MTPVLKSHPEKEKEDEGERESISERETILYCLICVSLIWSLKSNIFRDEPEHKKKKNEKWNLAVSTIYLMPPAIWNALSTITY